MSGLAASPAGGGGGSSDPLPLLELPPAVQSLDGATLNPGKVPLPPDVPAAPPAFGQTSLVSDTSGIGAEEAYSNDEKQLNNFLKLHPMLSLEATSQRTLQMLAGMFEKVTLQSVSLPLVPKSHDDCFLTTPKTAIGERPCVNGERCLARFVAQVRYGPETDMAFTCKEFLLPQQYADFKAGKGLPPRQGKCLLCCRYFQSYIALLARSDPSFKVGESPLGMQVFCNPVTHVPAATGDEADLQRAAAELPTSMCAVSSTDGYKPEATLFVDEDWMALRSAREGRLGQLLFRPCVRFCSTHYQYVKDSDGLRIVQVGIGADSSGRGMDFVGLPAATVVPSGADSGPEPVRLH